MHLQGNVNYMTYWDRSIVLQTKGSGMSMWIKILCIINGAGTEQMGSIEGRYT